MKFLYRIAVIIPGSLICLLYLLSSCTSGGSGKKSALFELTGNTGISFTNNVQNTKDFNIFNYRNFYNGAGVAIGDLNNDGLPEVLLTSNMGANKLFLNKGGFRFEDISAKAGIEEIGKWNTGVVMADINADGWLDIYICNAGIDKWNNNQTNALFINNHDLTFTEKAKEYGLDDKGYTTHAAFFDYDLDGDLDCYILNNSFIPVNTLNYSNKRELRAEDWPVKDFLKGGGDKLLRNENGRFTDVSKQAGIYGSLIGFGLGVTVGDINQDGYPDLYISNDFFERDYLYINQQNGTFKENLEASINHTSLASMGADIADINNDAFPDIFTTDMLPGEDYRLKTTSSFDNYDVFRVKQNQGFYYQYQQNALQVNNGNGRFRETAYYSGVSGTDWSWGALIFDADNDGLNDLYVCNGIYKDVIDQDFIDFFANDVIQRMAMTGEKEEVQGVIDSMPSVPVLNKAYRNTGELRFSDQGAEWGFTTPSFSNGAAYGDLDNDGDLDLVVNNVNMSSFVYKNKSRENKTGQQYIGFRLKGHGQNTFAVGSAIRIYCGKEIITRELIPARGFQSSTDYKIIAGIGSRTIDSVLISWPDKKISKLLKPAADSVHTINWPGQTASGVSHLPAGSTSTLFDTVPHPFSIHTENDFVDFYQERNLPVMLSKEGPRAAVADVNGDSLSDLVIGGGAGQPAQLCLQQATGKFKLQRIAAFETDKDFEDIALTFFDCDKDGDMDLYAGAGGNHLPPRHRLLQHRLYRNDGKGNFTKDSLAFPVNSANISVAAPYDFDEDGDIDLFIGGRSLSFNYGADPQSALLQNNGSGVFTDITQQLNPVLSRIGMVTATLWTDLTGDKKSELVIAGEWMAPRIFSYQNGKMQELQTALSPLNGWWQSLEAADMDGDGFTDLVLGNYGENFYLRPDEKQPVKLWIYDFDRNEQPDKVLSRTIDGKDMPVFLKREMTDAIPGLKKENLKHHDYATRSIQQLFNPEMLKQSMMKSVNYTRSCIAYNDGKGNFTVKEMPVTAQLSSIHALLCRDLNKDGKTDIIAAGNMLECLPQFGRLDASYGLALLNDGNRTFNELPAAASGIMVKGAVRDICYIPVQNKPGSVLFLRNSMAPQLYTFHNQP